MNTGPKLYTREDAAKLLSISPAKLDRLRYAGKIPTIKIGATTRFLERDLIDFIESSRVTGPREPTPLKTPRRRKHGRYVAADTSSVEQTG